MRTDEHNCDNEKLLREDYEAAFKAFIIEKEEREDIYRRCKAIDEELIECLGYCEETETMEEEFAEFKKQSDREISKMEEELNNLKMKLES